MLTQEQLDEIIRRVKGAHAIERLAWEGPIWQVYTLDNGMELSIDKITGEGTIKRQLNPTRWIIVKKF